MKRRWTRLLVRIGLGSAAVLLLPIALTLLDPDATWSLLTFVVRTATGSMRPPPIAADQIADANSQNLAETNRKLKVLFQQKFPPGSSEATLKATLLEQGFKPLPSPDKDCLPEGE